jgi:tungstate transport system ATP-binding protein
MPILQVKDLTAAQGGVQALHVPELEIGQGQVMAVVGPNGSGKTTMLLCLAGLLEPTGGRLLFNGQEIKGGAQKAMMRRHVTLVFQEPLLFNSTVRANIGSGLRLRGATKAERQRRVEETAELFGIPHLLNRSARKLSGGESQRVSLARALALRPQVLLMDEPFSALDAPSKQSLLADLGQILKKTGATAIFSTHDLMDAITLADQIAALEAGRLVQQGPVKDVLHSPQCAFVAAAIASIYGAAAKAMAVGAAPN